MSKVKRSLVLADFYRSYKIRCKEKGITPDNYKTYRKKITAMGEVMSDILLERGIIGMPWMIGDIFLKGYIPKVPVTDKKQSQDLKQRVIHFNEHTGGIVYSPYWLSPERQAKKRKQWCFSIFRGTKRELNKLLVSGAVKYPDFKMINARTISKT